MNRSIQILSILGLGLVVASANAQQRASSSFGSSGSSGFGGNSFGSSSSGNSAFGSSNSGFGNSGFNSSSFGQSGIGSNSGTGNSAFGQRDFGAAFGNNTMGGSNSGSTSRNRTSTNSRQQQSSRQNFGQASRGMNSFGNMGNNLQNRLGVQQYVRPSVQIVIDPVPIDVPTVTSSINNSFATPKVLTGYQNVQVNLTPAGVATITGSAETDRQRKVAALMLSFQPGVREVKNNLTIQPVQTPPSLPPIVNQ